eukprot:958526-Prymnesium_polylepis.1
MALAPRRVSAHKRRPGRVDTHGAVRHEEPAHHRRRAQRVRAARERARVPPLTPQRAPAAAARAVA